MKTINRALIRCGLLIWGALLAATAASGQTTNLAQLGNSVPNSLLVLTGQVVVISVTNMPVPTPPPTNGPQFQWVKDGILIDSATNPVYTIQSASTADVGTYSAFVMGAYARTESAPLNLGVYSLFYTNSNGGSLGVPIGQFTFGSTQLPCSGKTFQDWVVEFPFYGPNTGSQSGPFQNTSNSGYLDLSTCNSANGASLDTAILVKVNALPSAIVGCSDDAGAACGSNSGLSMVTVALQSNTSYRVTIFYRSATLGNLTSVAFSWYYHN